MKKGTIFAIAASIAAIAQLAIPGFASAQAVSYNSYENIPSLIDHKYAASKIYYTENTKITAKKVSRDGEASSEITRGFQYNVNKGDNVVFLIENSTAKDYSGNPVDVIFKIDNVRYASQVINNIGTVVETRGFNIEFAKSVCGSEKATPNGQDCNSSLRELVAGDPIVFWINTGYTRGDFSVQYIKKGSFNDSTLTGTPAGIEKLTYMAYDFDVPNTVFTMTYADEDIDNSLLELSNEATYVKSTDPSKTTYYYNRGYNGTEMPIMYEQDNGIAVQTINKENGYEAGFNGIHYATSYFAKIDDMQNSSYKFTYNATSAGIAVFFGSPVAYETPAPIKHIDNGASLVDANTAHPGEEFDYVIEQFVPNQFSSETDSILFSSVWNKYGNIKENRNYESFTINDTIDENLEIASENIKVTRGNIDVTEEFNILANGQSIAVIAKSAALARANFYGEKILVHIPVTVKADAPEGQIINTADTTVKNTSLSASNKESNDVTTDIVMMPENPKTDEEEPKNPDTIDEYIAPFFAMFGATTAGTCALLYVSTRRRR